MGEMSAYDRAYFAARYERGLSADEAERVAREAAGPAVAAPPEPVRLSALLAPVAAPAPAPPEPVAETDDDDADDDGDEEAGGLPEIPADGGGFAPSTRPFTFGGRETVRARPPARAACDALIERIRAEQRANVRARATDLTLDADGRLVPMAGATPLALTIRSFCALVSRLGYGGGAYLAKCEPPLRAANVNTWAGWLRSAEAAAGGEPQELVLRVRQALDVGPREVFAVVSTSYTPHDADVVAEAVRRALPETMRGAVAYDGSASRLEHLAPDSRDGWHFGALVTTDDTAGGAIYVYAIAWSDGSAITLVAGRQGKWAKRIRHVGNQYVLTTQLQAAFRRADASAAPFLAAWQRAVREDALARTRTAYPDEGVPDEPHLAAAGIFRALAEGQRLKIAGGKRGRARAVTELVEHWHAAVRGGLPQTSRAAIVEAIARYAATLDPWDAGELESSASTLLWGRGPKGAPRPLPYSAPDEDDDAVDLFGHITTDTKGTTT